MSQGDAPFSWPVRVYWEDTDAGGVVFYANYLKFFERARTEWLRNLGQSQQVLREQTGAIFIVSHTQVRHLAPARLADRCGDARSEAFAHRVRYRARRRHRLEQQAVAAILRQLFAQVGEQRRQVLRLGGANGDQGLRHSARAIRIFWMSLVPS